MLVMMVPGSDAHFWHRKQGRPERDKGPGLNQRKDSKVCDEKSEKNGDGEPVSAVAKNGARWP